MRTRATQRRVEREMVRAAIERDVFVLHPLFVNLKFMLRGLAGARNFSKLGQILQSPRARVFPILVTRKASTLVASDAQKSTIYALSTPPGKAGVAVVRVSGPAAFEVWRSVVRPTRTQPQSLPDPWKLHRCRIVDSSNEDTIDDGLAVFFRGRKYIVTSNSFLLWLIT